MKTIVLTFDDAVQSHLTFVAPLLKKINAGATFFICRFDDQWRAKHESALLTGEQIRAIAELGFEIGNHTWNHPDLRGCDDATVASEIDRLTDFLRAAGVPGKEVSFAYPGGPFAANATGLLTERGFMLARTVEYRLWNIAKDDPLRVPSYSIQGDDPAEFHKIIDSVTEDSPAVLVFHGVPDLVHGFVSTPQTRFEYYIRVLQEKGFRIMGMRECFMSYMNKGNRY